MKHSGHRAALAAIVVSVGLADTASAAKFYVSGSWSVTITGQGYTDQVFAGSATFDFDDTFIRGPGFNNTQGRLTALSMSPATIGTTTFDLSNVSYLVNYKDGNLHQVIVGGDPGTVQSLTFLDDDFSVSQHFGGGLNVIGISVGTEDGDATRFQQNIDQIDFTVSSTPIPEPTAALAGCAMIAGLFLRRRK